MRETSALYKTLRQDPDSVYEVNIVRGQTVYGMNDIISASVHQSLIGERPGPSVGGTVSARCSITIREESVNWPRMASFEVRVRLCSADGLQTSEWLSLGVFLTDQRSKSKYGNLSIEAFDAMLMLDQYWTDQIPQSSMPESWPITAAEAASLLVQATGIQLDSRDVLDDTVAFIGLDTLRTAREVWADIAAAQGGNAILTPEGKSTSSHLPTPRPENTAPLPASPSRGWPSWALTTAAEPSPDRVSKSWGSRCPNWIPVRRSLPSAALSSRIPPGLTPAPAHPPGTSCAHPAPTVTARRQASASSMSATMSTAHSRPETRIWILPWSLAI